MFRVTGFWGGLDGASAEAAGAGPWVAGSPRTMMKLESRWAAINSSYSRIMCSQSQMVNRRRIRPWRSSKRNPADSGLGVWLINITRWFIQMINKSSGS